MTLLRLEPVFNFNSLEFQTQLYRLSPKKTSQCTGWCLVKANKPVAFVEVALLQPCSRCASSPSLPPDHQCPHTSCRPLQQGLCQGCQVGWHDCHVLQFSISILTRFGGEVRAEMLKGVNVLADAVAVSFCVNISTRKDLIKTPCSAGDHGPQG